MTQRIETVDAIVAGDGPAGSALAAALVRCGVEVRLVGRDDPWRATYGTWVDDLDTATVLAGHDVLAHRTPDIAVVTSRVRRIERPYGVIDNARLRSVLRSGVEHRRADVVAIDRAGSGRHDHLRLDDGSTLAGRVVVDARGSSPAATVGVPRQTAIGVVLDEPPDGYLGAPVLMDWSVPEPADPGAGPPSFVYALPVDDGWLVEETVLAARPRTDAPHLLDRLARRLDMSSGELERSARRIEHVDIPMGGPLPARRGDDLGFGAAAGMIHPATGYSVASSLRRATPVAVAIGTVLADDPASVDVVRDRVRRAVWPRAMRRTRALHDYGLDVLLGLDAAQIAGFFDAFFDLPTEHWARYLRIETPPTELAATMLRVFGAADWGMRRRLVSANPRAFARLARG